MPSLKTSKTLVVFGISLLALLPELYSQEESGVLQLSPLVIDADRLVQPQAYDDSNAGMTLSTTLLGGAQIGLLELSEAVAQYPAYAAFRRTPARAALASGGQTTHRAHRDGARRGRDGHGVPRLLGLTLRAATDSIASKPRGC